MEILLWFLASLSADLNALRCEEPRFQRTRMQCALPQFETALFNILVPRGRAPFGQHQESRPLAKSNTRSPRFTDCPSLCACSESSLTNLIGSGPNLLCFQSHSKPERRWTWSDVAIVGADQKERALGTRMPYYIQDLLIRDKDRQLRRSTLLSCFFEFRRQFRWVPVHDDDFIVMLRRYMSSIGWYQVRRTGMKENAVIFYFRTGGDAFSQNIERSLSIFWVYLGVKTCEVFLSFVVIVRVRAIVLTSLFSLICFTSLVSVTGFYTEDEPVFLIVLSYMHTPVAAMCAALLAEFRTSGNLTGFHVFALMHVFAQLHSLFFKLSFGDWSFYNWAVKFYSLLRWFVVLHLCSSCHLHLAE